jgi:hypothetical protein
VRVSAKRLLDTASYGLRLSPPPRRETVSHLRLAAERYRTAASRQHLDAVLARYRQKWINEPETLDVNKKYWLVLSAKAAVNEIVRHHPERADEFSHLNELIEDLRFRWSEDRWESFRRELLQVLPDLDDPLIDQEAMEAIEMDRHLLLRLIREGQISGSPPSPWTDLIASDHEEKGFGE